VRLAPARLKRLRVGAGGRFEGGAAFIFIGGARNFFGRAASKNMGGFGSGRGGGGPTVESALRLDIDDMMQWGGIRALARLAGEMRFNFYGDQIEVKFESRMCDPWNSWLRLRYSMTEYSTGEELEIDDQIYLAATRPHFGGLRWWFVCPHLNRRVRKLYLPRGGRHFWSRRAYELAYASQRGTK
jgi:hypothetical protein